MNRSLCYLAVAILFLAGASVAQSSDLNSSAPSTDQATQAQPANSSPAEAESPAKAEPSTSVSTADPNSAPVPVTPDTVVPNAENGQDPFGRPVQPVTPGATKAPEPLPPNQQQEFRQTVKDVFFDFDQAELRPDDQTALQQDAEWLKAHPDVTFTIAGQADPRGDIVYNLFLSDRRALATRDALVKMGVPQNQILFAEGWGKLYPVCEQEDETCWSQDRRAHLEPWSPLAGPAKEGTVASGLE